MIRLLQPHKVLEYMRGSPYEETVNQIFFIDPSL